MQPTFGSRAPRVEIVVAIDEAQDPMVVKLSVVNKAVDPAVAIPKIKAVAAQLGIELSDDDAVFKGLGEPERHTHLHEERSRVQHKQRA